MSVHWFVDTSLPGNVYETALSLGFAVTKDNDPFTLNGEPFVYGPISYVRKRSAEIGYGSYINPVTMSVSGSFPFLIKECLLNDDYILIPFGTFRRDYQRFFDMFGSQLFIRSNSGSKTIPGQVLTVDNVDFELNSLRQLSSAMDDTICVLASVKPIKKEYRLFMTGNRFITGSSYSWNNEPYENVPSYVITFAEAVVEEWQPEEVYTIDIAVTPEGLKVVEFNSASSSGLYGSDTKKFVSGISEYLKNI